MTQTYLGELPPLFTVNHGGLRSLSVATVLVSVILLGTSLYFVSQGSIDARLLPYDLGTRGLDLIYPLVITVLVAPRVFHLYAHGFVRYLPPRVHPITFLRRVFGAGVLSAAIPMGLAFFFLFVFSFYIEPSGRLDSYPPLGQAPPHMLESLGTVQFPWLFDLHPLAYGLGLMVWQAAWAGVWAVIVVLCVINIHSVYIALAVPTLIYFVDIFGLQILSFLEPASAAIAIFPSLVITSHVWQYFLALAVYSACTGLVLWRTFSRGFTVS